MGFASVIRFIALLNMPVVTAHHISLSHADKCRQSWSSLCSLGSIFLWVPELSLASAASFLLWLLTYWLCTDSLLCDSRLRLTLTVTLWLAVYCQSVHLGTKLLEAQYQWFSFFKLNPCGCSPYITSFLRRGCCSLVTAGFTIFTFIRHVRIVPSPLPPF